MMLSVEGGKSIANGCETHLVLKVEDLRGALSSDEIRSLLGIIHKVEAYRELQGKNPEPRYLVCNEDEPYAGVVERAILDGELKKEEAKDSEEVSR